MGNPTGYFKSTMAEHGRFNRPENFKSATEIEIEGISKLNRQYQEIRQESGDLKRICLEVEYKEWKSKLTKEEFNVIVDGFPPNLPESFMPMRFKKYFQEFVFKWREMKEKYKI